MSKTQYIKKIKESSNEINILIIKYNQERLSDNLFCCLYEALCNMDLEECSINTDNIIILLLGPVFFTNSLLNQRSPLSPFLKHTFLILLEFQFPLNCLLFSLCIVFYTLNFLSVFFWNLIWWFYDFYVDAFMKHFVTWI